MKNVVTLKTLAEHLNDPDWVVVDCRFQLGQPGAGQAAYEQEHISGAVYMDLEKDMSGEKTAHGGRHPLPDLGPFSQKLGRIGIDDTVKVVAYDDQDGAMAARFWWMLRFLGHREVYVLEAGFARWKAEGYPVSNERTPDRKSKNFSAKIQTEMMVSMEDVRQRLGRTDTVLIDSRDKARYRGANEPIDPVAGHIPGAVNFFWKGGIAGGGTWKPASAQRERFATIDPNEEVIVYCGSGVTACPNVLALEEAGYNNVKLYAGSWSDWISYQDNPVATGGE